MQEPEILSCRPRELKLLDDAANPNRMSGDDYLMLVAEIREFGFLQPPLVREVKPGELEVIDGAHRVRAALEIGIERIPVVRVKAGDDHAIALTIAMNKLRGSLDLTKVARMATRLVEEFAWKPEDLKLTGYEREDIDALLASSKVPTTQEILDDAAASDFVDAERDEQAEYDANPKPFVLELKFATAAELKRAKRGLKKAAGGGRAADMSAGLVRLLEGA